MCLFFWGTDRDAALCRGLLVGEVAHSPGQVVGRHPRGSGKVIGHPAIFLGHSPLHRHVGQRGVLLVVTQGQGERGLVDGLVKTGEGLPGVDGTELGHSQVTVEEIGTRVLRGLKKRTYEKTRVKRRKMKR